MLISEIFGPTIQGEGAMIGRHTVFVRLGGCDYRCSWCDSMYAVDPAFKSGWTKMEPAAVLAEVDRLVGTGGSILITLSGGNPALQDECQEFIRLAHTRGHRVAMETQGSVAKAWFGDLDHLVVSPKPPSSGHAADPAMVAQCLDLGPTDTSLKFVINDQTDLDWAHEFTWADDFREIDAPVFLQACHHPGADPLDRMKWLIDLSRRFGWLEASVLPQLHVALWGESRGV